MNKDNILGTYLHTIRKTKRLSLREVEEATGNDISNAYLSQLENGKIVKPSPHILYSLSEVYGISYDGLMERAGYIAPKAERKDGQKHGMLATHSIENLTAEEEDELLKYLAYVRTKKA